MDDYIERDKLLEDFELCNKQNPRWTPQRVKSLIVRANAADVAPVVHGRWGSDDFWRYCTNCNEYALFYESGEYVQREPYLTPYCPNCAARMDGDRNDK